MSSRGCVSALISRPIGGYTGINAVAYTLWVQWVDGPLPAAPIGLDMSAVPLPVYKPSKRQHQFSQLAWACNIDGAYGISVWCQASRMLVDNDMRARLPDDSPLKTFAWDGDPVTVREWNRWWANPDFQMWWGELFPEVEGPTEADLRAADGLFWMQLGRGLRAGNVAHLQLYNTLRIAREKVEAGATLTGGSLDGHFEESDDDSDNGWVVPAAK